MVEQLNLQKIATINNKRKMKTLKKFLLGLALPFLAGSILVSCEDNANGTAAEEPTIVLDNEGGRIAADTAVNPSATLNFRIVATQNASSKKNLRRVLVERVFNNTPEVVLDSNINESTITLDVSITAQAIAGTENIIFTVFDKDNETDRKTVRITTIGLEVRNGDIRHIAGPNGCLGSFDLVNVVGLSSNATNDPNRDMANTDQAGNAFTGSFEAKNSTLFRIPNAFPAFDYANATEASIEQAYATSVNQPTATIGNPAKDDVILVNLRGTGRYAAILITGNDADDNSCNASAQNKGKLSFEYKIANDVVAN